MLINNTDSLVVIDFDNKSTSIIDYSGWDLERRFCPTLVVSTQEHEKIVFEGYERVWQLLDTVCYEQPLGRRNFNPVLKHRLDGFDETSLDIIRGVISEGDTKKIMVQGEVTKDGWFVVDFSYQNFTDEIQPALHDVASLLMGEGSEHIVFGNYEFIKRDKTINFKRTSITVPSIVAIFTVSNNHKHIIRVVQMPSGKLGFLTNIISDNEKYAGITPHLFDKDEVEAMIRYIRFLFYRSHQVYTRVCENIEIPKWVQERTVGSTLKHFKYNADLLKAAL